MHARLIINKQKPLLASKGLEAKMKPDNDPLSFPPPWRRLSYKRVAKSQTESPRTVWTCRVFDPFRQAVVSPICAPVRHWQQSTELQRSGRQLVGKGHLRVSHSRFAQPRHLPLLID
jgi:hypothetical protein